MNFKRLAQHRNTLQCIAIDTFSSSVRFILYSNNSSTYARHWYYIRHV